MRRPRAQINEMRLRVPWMQRAQAQRLGKMVAEQLAGKPMSANQPSRTIPSLKATVRSEADRSFEVTAKEIADSVRRKL